MAYHKFASCYDRLMEHMPYSEWIRFAKSYWSMSGEPGTVVDLGCGTGSLAIPLAQSGIKVYGLDLSESMLAIAREKAESVARTSAFSPNGSVTWIQQDMREWELPVPVDSVISFCDCLNYLLEEEHITQTFRSVNNGLREGGCFLFDVLTEHLYRAYAAEQPFTLDEGDIAYIWTCDYDEDRRMIEHDLTIFAQVEGVRDASESHLYQRIEERHVQRAYPLDWLAEQLEQAGFKEIACYGDFRFKAADAQTERAFFTAKK